MGKRTLFFYILLLFLSTSTLLEEIVRTDHGNPYFLMPTPFRVLVVGFLSYKSWADADYQKSIGMVHLFPIAGFCLLFDDSKLFLIMLMGWYMRVKTVPWLWRTSWGFHAFPQYSKIRERFGNLYLLLFTGCILTELLGRRVPRDARTPENQNATNATAQGRRFSSSAQRANGLRDGAKVTESAGSSLTFGVELEFIVKIRGTDLELKQVVNNDYQFLVYKAIAQILKSAGLEVYDPKGTQISHTSTPDKHEKWNVGEDSTLEHEEKSTPDFQYLGVEASSPILPANDMGFAEVRNAIAALHKVEKVDLSFFTNDTCGLHGHVGNGTSSYELRTLKNLCKLVTVFESQINAIHPAIRVQGYWVWATCAPPSMMQSFMGKSGQECAGMIDKVGSVGALIELMNPSALRFVATNLLSLDIRTTKTDKNGVTRVGGTVEFRQHSGSLDADEVVAWVLVTTGLVEAARATDERYLKLLLPCFLPASVRTTDLLRMIGRSETIEYYKDRLHDHANTSSDTPKGPSLFSYEELSKP